MLIFENISLALTAIKANIMRAILTMLGIVIGVAAVIGIMTVGNAVSAEMDSDFSDGMTNIEVRIVEKFDEEQGPRRGHGMGPTREKTLEDYFNSEIINDVYTKYKNKIEAIALENQIASSATAIDGNSKAKVNIIGVNRDAFKGLKYDIVAGREINASEYEDAKRAAMVSEELVDSIYHGDSDAAVGSLQSVLIEGRYYTYKIVGVYKVDDDEYEGFDAEETSDIYIPIKTSMNQTHQYDRYESFTVVAASMDGLENMSDEIESYINRRYYRDNPGFEAETFAMATFFDEIKTMMNGVRIGLGFIAGISLLVGGIGVMNIMLVSITERTREIGTRKALGATNSSIRIQFIVESTVLCIAGGILGIVLGVLVGYIGCKALETEFVLSGMSIIIAVGFSAAVGLFFGYYPANKAARMNPIDALRYE